MTLVIETTHSGLSTRYQPSVYVGHRFIGGPIGLWGNEVPLATKYCTWVLVLWSTAVKLCSCWWKRQADITSTLTHWMKDSAHFLADYRGNALVLASYCSNGAHSQTKDFTE